MKLFAQLCTENMVMSLQIEFVGITKTLKPLISCPFYKEFCIKMCSCKKIKMANSNPKINSFPLILPLVIVSIWWSSNTQLDDVHALLE